MNECLGGGVIVVIAMVEANFLLLVGLISWLIYGKHADFNSHKLP